MLSEPHFFSADHFLFLFFPLYYSYTIHLESNWYMDTGVRDLENAFFKANSTWFNDICSKDLSNTPIYAVLNTHNLDMILQL